MEQTHEPIKQGPPGSVTDRNHNLDRMIHDVLEKLGAYVLGHPADIPTIAHAIRPRIASNLGITQALSGCACRGQRPTDP